MSTPEAVHCSGCGRDLGLEPIPRDDTLACPDCHEAMAALDCGPGAVHDCGRCGGQFVEMAALRDLIERHDRLDVGAPRSGARAAIETRVHYVACPVCRSLMNRRNFGGVSGVVVDVCAKHGTWFDLGELPRVLAFAESGGLTRSRTRDAAARERALRERVDGAAGAPLAHRLGGDDDVEHVGGSVLSEILAAFFGE